MDQALDFLEDSRQLFNLLLDKSDENFKIETQFKNWTIDDVIGHLHIFNFAANLSLKSSKEFEIFFSQIDEALKIKSSLLDIQNLWLNGLVGQDLLNAWWKETRSVSKNFKIIDPKLRLKWAGPDMSARSSITARQMETWAHGQEIFDALGEQRQEGDRIKNICHLGIVTYDWTFKNRQMSIPEPAPYVRLIAPSGQVWEWNDSTSNIFVQGSAVEFAQVVTQVRSIEDTSLEAVGSPAKSWMSLAQCFAGKPETPPKKGSRYRI